MNNNNAIANERKLSTFFLLLLSFYLIQISSICCSYQEVQWYKVTESSIRGEKKKNGFRSRR